MEFTPVGYVRYYGHEEHYPFYYIRDYLGNVREVWGHPWLNHSECVQRTQYYPSGLPWNEGYSPSEQPYKYGGKEFVEMHGLDEYDSEARWYYPAIMRTTTMDPLCEKYPDISPYAWCGNNPVKNVDPTGKNPIYSLDGKFLGTDDLGLQGEAIIMDSKLFTQSMSNEMSSFFNLEEDFLSDESYQKYIDQFNSLSSRPDWDGYISFNEANDWYKSGDGEPLFADLEKIDLSGIVSLGEKYVGQRKTFNLLLNSRSIEAGLVYGNITLKRYPHHQVRAFSDFYDFEMHPWRSPSNWKRNIETIIGNKIAGNGIPYTIHFYGF